MHGSGCLSCMPELDVRSPWSGVLGYEAARPGQQESNPSPLEEQQVPLNSPAPKVRVTHSLSLSRLAPSPLTPIPSLNGLHPLLEFLSPAPSIFACLSKTSPSTTSTNRSRMPQGYWSSVLPLTSSSIPAMVHTLGCLVSEL